MAVAPAEMANARVVVTQDDVDRILEGVERIEVRLASAPWRSVPAELARTVPRAGFRLPSAVLSTKGGGRFVTTPGDDLSLASGERVFEFELNLPSTAASTPIGTRLHVRFDHGAEPLAAQWYRDLQQLFLKRLPG
jgi:putative peptide zinc metalloprotease protein